MGAGVTGVGNQRLNLAGFDPEHYGCCHEK
jgi:hypothetical protein